MLLHLDCAAGINGTSALAALAHLGVDYVPLAEILTSAGLPCSIDVKDAAGLAGPGRTVSVQLSHAGGQPCKLADVTDFFERVAVSARVRQRALAVARALAGACAHVGQQPADAVLPDAGVPCDGQASEEPAGVALIQILGVAYGLEQLGVEKITASAMPLFSGSVAGAHGCTPLPRPATAFLMQGKTFFATNAREELVTPLGAAFVHALANETACGTQGRVAAIGTGYGAESTAIALRAWLMGQMEGMPAGRADHARGGNEAVVQLESHIDHLNGEDLGMALTALSAMAEVLDALWLPGIGKKNRPAGLLRVLCLPEHRHCVAEAVLRHTHTLGLRVQTLERIVAPRHAATANVAGQRLPAKAYVIDGQTYLRPEADALEAEARKRGIGVPALRNARDGDWQD